ncbi:MAG: 3-deoxy-manno-octulosonate cytidylyltransferase [Phycisphaerales bacterium]|jgi:3-deoxy-manno-octulosonate cytidylyltransferase (CMP-KDO synthetase)|nr:3-deoxy-manno-octulosonate cytidylyltransferase [Phycisphaerales bacterium]
MPDVIAIIPTRMGSTRFPGKAIASQTGMPLILHVVDAVASADIVERVLVASEDAEIAEVCAAANVEHVMTSQGHPNGSSRIAEVAKELDAAVILNVQGDEPEIEAGTLDAAVTALLNDETADVGTVATPIRPDDDPRDPNLVKVVVGLNGQALYFSRSLIPASVSETSPLWLRHIGIYAYRASVLARYASLTPTPAERSERLEQLRFLEHGYRIAVAQVDAAHPGIDTPEQYDAFVARWAERSNQ